VTLVEQRDKWAEEFKTDSRYPALLERYKENRTSELWRASRQVEEVLEYVLFLETCVYGDWRNDAKHYGRS
jgi:hypothetical protein